MAFMKLLTVVPCYSCKADASQAGQQTSQTRRTYPPMRFPTIDARLTYPTISPCRIFCIAYPPRIPVTLPQLPFTLLYSDAIVTTVRQILKLGAVVRAPGAPNGVPHPGMVRD